jgi:hypothetical protein
MDHRLWQVKSQAFYKGHEILYMKRVVIGKQLHIHFNIHQEASCKTALNMSHVATKGGS